MRPSTPRYIQQTANILSRPATLQFARTQPLNQIQTASMSSGLNIENTNIKTAPGVTLEEQQKTLVGSVLDLFAGRPSLEKLQLWKDEGVFEDPITIAEGRKQYEAQWVRNNLLWISYSNANLLVSAVRSSVSVQRD